MRIEPLRPFERVLAAYAALAFALGAAESVVVREWSFAVLGAALSTAGLALLVHDHRRWRAAREGASRPASEKKS
jgi:hypothetical protein